MLLTAAVVVGSMRVTLPAARYVTTFATCPASKNVTRLLNVTLLAAKYVIKCHILVAAAFTYVTVLNCMCLQLFRVMWTIWRP